MRISKDGDTMKGLRPKGLGPFFIGECGCVRGLW